MIFSYVIPASVMNRNNLDLQYGYIIFLNEIQEKTQGDCSAYT